MRTLEEIIKELETVGKKKVIQRNDLDDKIVINMPLLIATLDYLKEYRAEKGSLANARALTEEAYEKHKRWIENCKKAHDKYKSLELGLIHAHADLLDNPPLGWEELKQMEGKPVWVEFLNDDPWDDPSHGVDSEWWVIGEVRKDDIILATYLDEMELCEEDIGIIWQAYRKERK